MEIEQGVIEFAKTDAWGAFCAATHQLEEGEKVVWRGAASRGAWVGVSEWRLTGEALAGGIDARWLPSSDQLMAWLRKRTAEIGWTFFVGIRVVGASERVSKKAGGRVIKFEHDNTKAFRLALMRLAVAVDQIGGDE